MSISQEQKSNSSSYNSSPKPEKILPFQYYLRFNGCQGFDESGLFPFNCCRGLAGNIINHPVDSANLIDDTVGSPGQQFSR